MVDDEQIRHSVTEGDELVDTGWITMCHVTFSAVKMIIMPLILYLMMWLC